MTDTLKSADSDNRSTLEEALIKFCEDVMNLHPSRLLKNDLECGGLTPLLNFARNHIDES